MLDEDLAALYRVEVRALNQAVARNRPRFPPDFMFRLTRAEAEELRSRTVISNRRGGRRYLPVFGAIRELMAPPSPTARKIGYRPDGADG